MSDKPLTERQQRFADYYIELGNATEAYRRAGYSPKGADVSASKLLVNPRVRARIDSRLAEAEAARVASGNEVLRFLTASMRGEVEEDVVVVEGAGLGCSEAKVIQKKLGARDRIKSAEHLAKVHRLFTAEEKKGSGTDAWTSAVVAAAARREAERGKANGKPGKGH